MPLLGGSSSPLKLGQTSPAKRPLSLSKMVNGQIGGESNHGKANTRILKELGVWIESNSAAVEGFDPNKPALSQIDKLSDKQLRALACSRDPACTDH